jgi:hypothetical protein
VAYRASIAALFGFSVGVIRHDVVTPSLQFITIADPHTACSGRPTVVGSLSSGVLHAITGELSVITAGPTESMTPSVPHIVVLVIRTMASPGCVIFGFGPVLQ